jgi:Na+/melibiose symporter-like transporter
LLCISSICSFTTSYSFHQRKFVPIENTCTIGFLKLLRDKRNLIIESPTHNKLKFDEIQASFKNKNFLLCISFICSFTTSYSFHQRKFVKLHVDCVRRRGTHNKLKFDEIQASFKNKNFPKATSFDCLSFIRTAHRLPGRPNLSSR